METIVEEPSENPSDADPVLEFETEDSDETATEISDEEFFKDKRIFISHKCDVDLDEEIAARLYADLVGLGCEVYLDKAEPIGVRFEEAIDDSLRRADFVVAVLTKDSNDSDWVKAELKYAHELFRQQGHPVIIPVKIGAFQLAHSIGAVCGGFNFHTYGPSEYLEILADIKEGIQDHRRLRERTILTLEGFRFREFQRTLTRAASIDSPQLRLASTNLRQEKLFWVVGDSGARNHFARVLAVNEFDQAATSNGNSRPPSIYEVPPSFNWSRVAETLVHDSIIIFPDVNPSLLSDESQGKELDSLRSLAEQNLVIVTATKESYEELQQDMRNRDLNGGEHVEVDHNFYNEQDKLKIFEQLLNVLSGSHNITQRQQKWARSLLEDAEDREVFKSIVKKWSPDDIERFIRTHLQKAKRPGDVVDLLQRNAHLDDEIHSWFIALDDSTRCFVLALAMLSGLRKEALWENYKLIVQRLKKLDAYLSLWPLGICRERADPYVTSEGHLAFVDERIAETIYREISSNFREYLIELVPLIKEMSVPAGREQKMTKEVFEARKQKVTETKDVRVALARITGKAGKAGLEGFTELLELWGSDPALPVREAVALSLEHAVAERIGGRQAIDLLQRWCTDASNRSKPFRVWAAASALGSIVAVKPANDVKARALDLLERLAGGNYPSIKFFVSIALKKPARKVPLVDEEAPVSLELLLRLIASDEDAATKINVAEALIESRIADEAAALRVVQNWLAGDNDHCRWAAMCSFVLWRKQTHEERNREVIRFLAIDPQMIANVLVEVLNNKHQKMPVFWKSFCQLVLTADAATKRALVCGLARQPQSSLEAQLMPLLRASADPMLKELVGAVRAERWEQMLSTPLDFIDDLHEVVHQEHLTGEVHAAFARLLKAWPEGRRDLLIQALVSCFTERRTTLEEILTRLTMIAPMVFEPFSLEVRCEALRSLFQTPEILLRAIGEGLGDTKIAGETSVALELLTRTEPAGHHEELINALTSVQAFSPSSVRSLLRQFRSMNSTVLSNFTHEFNLRLLANELAYPEKFIARVSDAMNDRFERAEVTNILHLLSMPAPQGRRRALVQALGIAKLARPAVVNTLLLDSSWQTRSGLLSLSMEVKLFSFLSRITSPKFTSEIFGFDS